MISLVYSIAPELQESETAWLRAQKVYPAVQHGWDWDKLTPTVKMGVIVSPEQALSIKLRHKIDKQGDYRQR
jgi:hypothetical protein